MEKIYKYVAILGTVVSILLYILLSVKTSRYNDMSNVVSAVNSEISRYRDKYNREVTKREAIETTDINNFLRFKTTDSLILELQNTVNDFKKEIKRGGSATVFEGETNIDKSSVTNVFYKDSNAVYTTLYNDKWVDYNIVATKDSTLLNFKVKNKYSVVIGREKISLFKSLPYAKVTNYNPYSSVKDTRTYRIKLKDKKIGIGPNVSYGITSDFTPKIYIGVGLQYNIIKL